MFPILVFALVFLISCLVLSWQLTVRVGLLLFPRSVNRRAQACLQRAWVDSLGCLFPEVTLMLTGDALDPSQPTILICNHQVDADWWFLWVLGRTCKMHGHIKIILKAALKAIPVLGQGMMQMEFIFLKRKLEEDKPHLLSTIHSFVAEGFPLWLMIFPEGTTVHKEAVVRSNEFAAAAGRPQTKHVLVPRVAGFEAALSAMGDSINEVCDVTICYSGYSGEVPCWQDGYTRKLDCDIPNLLKLARRQQPGPIFCHIKRHSVLDIRKQGVAQWLDQRFQEKDAILAHFAATNKMPELGPVREYKDHGHLAPLALLSTPMWVLLGLGYCYTLN
eukprot:NODE_2812_length_1085_cov_3.377871_g2682_i0.p1 GENE.NODE_2812_length_1085_cov_3.377871_g2682_i0~~NODE_2812_length_1085_cov_3.377871_g2682_i0.p1  ORF type:complete len:344 (-),score=101.32 NODE_2812_length_1085_cov_3.377871_g2682_i0:52-1047(-)